LPGEWREGDVGLGDPPFSRRILRIIDQCAKLEVLARFLGFQSSGRHGEQARLTAVLGAIKLAATDEERAPASR
jgi:hypothetical protein